MDLEMKNIIKIKIVHSLAKQKINLLGSTPGLMAAEMNRCAENAECASKTGKSNNCGGKKWLPAREQAETGA